MTISQSSKNQQPIKLSTENLADRIAKRIHRLVEIFDELSKNYNIDPVDYQKIKDFLMEMDQLIKGKKDDEDDEVNIIDGRKDIDIPFDKHKI